MSVFSIPPTGQDDPVDRFAARLLAGPLTVLLLGLVGLQVLTWLPHYLTWPYWVDHDVFANGAFAWQRGELPYRDTRSNNFPGSIYLFFLLGKTVGWGRTWGLFAVDAGLLFALFAALIVWSRRCFGRALPGVVGVVIVASGYFSLDYTQVAQRDWHSPVLAVLGLLVAQAWTGRASRAVSALAFAAAFAVRPQAILFVPVFLYAVVVNQGPGPWVSDRGKAAWGLIRWGLVAALGVALAFAPLAVAGVFDDFLRNLQFVAPGSKYNGVSLASVVRAWVLQSADWRWWSVPAAVVLFGLPFHTRASRTAFGWVLAMACVSVYKPLSPFAHGYLGLPLKLVCSVAEASLIGVILDRRNEPAGVKLVLVLLTLGLGPTTLRPTYCKAKESLQVARAWLHGEAPKITPPGYGKDFVFVAGYYPWADHAALIDYLKRSTAPETRVANVLNGQLPVVSMSVRPSALPAESVTWLSMVYPGDEPRFAEALSCATDSVVVWSPDLPGPVPGVRFDLINDVIRRDYRPEARFGDIEVWRRKRRGHGRPSASRNAGVRPPA